ncbi:DNA-binding protein [Thermodesulfobium narugense]|uniref:DNA-binding protein n=1 Tax=Thermodesulfobium narugense TaxID=184064 RepID=UPI00059BFD6E|nr:DNA-binding protein [Thermodesulfobium narugense]
MEDWVTIINLKKRNPSMGTRKIAKILGVSRNTVKRALKSETYPSYERGKMVYKELESFHEFIKEAFVFKRQRVSAIISNLRSKGYNGSNIAVYRYINEHFKELKGYFYKNITSHMKHLLVNKCNMIGLNIL